MTNSSRLLSNPNYIYSIYDRLDTLTQKVVSKICIDGKEIPEILQELKISSCRLFKICDDVNRLSVSTQKQVQ